jgi:hypothetical protein
MDNVYHDVLCWPEFLNAQVYAYDGRGWSSALQGLAKQSTSHKSRFEREFVGQIDLLGAQDELTPE